MKTISNRQFAFIVIIFISSTADILLPTMTAILAGRDSWLSVILAAIFASVIVLIQARLVQRFPGKFFPEYARILLGPYLGNLLTVLYLLFLIYISAAIIGEINQISKTVFFMQTPEIILALLQTIAAAYAVFLGIEVVARVIEAAFPIGIFVRVILIFVVYGDLEMSRFLPIFDQGFIPIYQGSLRVTGWLGESMILLFLSHHIQNIKKIGRTMVLSIWFVALILLLGSLSIAYFGPQQAANITFPIFEIIRMFEVGGIRGLDSLIMTFWYSATLFKIIILFYIVVITVKKLTNGQGNTFIFPVALVFTVLPIILFVELSGTMEFLTNTWPGMAMTFELFIPALLLLVAILKKQPRGGV
ncbi:GerAB/ArcD/ProY family transporter [Desulforamulus aquiferis]|uniref:Endospore germination permease n=1 Tax=Desulforamulus aquiferis TaxID=1397668 RepID=A0AAW7ZA99_9FIRM|nr:endospore germination permease [Desulforamulus aquiferis]MDO7786638.1 endospore germination permease [Desulforamulus aquiferis]RYD05859.1 hypothetical protein N752_08165 [Desulforamulus aquiferis]